MTKETAVKAGKDMIYLAACALHGRIPAQDELGRMNLKQVYSMAKFHYMQSIVYICLSNCLKEYGESSVEPEVMGKLQADYQLTMKRLVMFDIEREAFCQFLGQRSWYLCLKGVVLQRYYPALGMRQMADNDILVDVNLCPEIRDYFISRGYKSESYGVGCHDSYLRGVLNFEIHRKLFMNAVRTRRGADYYKDVKSRLIPGEKPGEMLFQDNDFYVYFLYHAYKHYAEGGSGVRTLMDIFVYRSKNENLDEKYINKQLDLLAIRDYADSSYELAMRIFSAEARPGDVLDAQLEEMLEYYITSGTFGTQAHTGICVEYDFSKLFSSLSDALLLPVNYSKNRPLLNIQSIYDPITKQAINDRLVDEFPNVIRSWITKSKEWEREKEWRLILFPIHKDCDRKQSLPIISRIITGINISDDNYKRAEKIAEHHGVPIHRTRLKNDQYKIEIID